MSRKPYVREISTTGWWLKRPQYVRYMSREVTCIFVGALALLMLWGLMRLSQGAQAYADFLGSLRSPGGVVLTLLILAFSLHNATSWFNVTPKAMPVQVGEEFLSGKIIIGAHYAVWAVVSLVVMIAAGGV